MPRRFLLPRPVAFVSVAVVYATVMLGGTIPIPLWDIWAHRLGFGPFVVTLAFGLYAVGTMTALTVFSSWSDRAGRRPVLLAGLVLSASSAALLPTAPSVLVVLAARVLGGLGAGLITATASAALSELAAPGHADRAALVATVSNVGGLGAGIAVAAVAIQIAGEESSTVALLYALYLVVIALAAVATLLLPETVAERTRGVVSLRRPTVPGRADRRRLFAWAGAGVFVAFAVTGLFSSLVPTFLRQQLGIRAPVVPGLVVALLFVAGLVMQTLAPPPLAERVWPAAGSLALGTVVYELGLLTTNLAVFVVGTAIAGAGFGLTFRRGISVSQRVAEPGARADQLASYFFCAYGGNILPTLGLGLVSQALGNRAASAILAVAIVAAAMIVGVGASRARPDVARTQLTVAVSQESR